MAAMAFATRVVFGNRVVPPKELLAVVDGTGQAMFDASVSAKVSALAFRRKSPQRRAPPPVAPPRGTRPRARAHGARPLPPREGSLARHFRR